MSNRGYDSVSELLEDLSDDEQFRREVESEIAEQRLATKLFAMRNHYGLTQSQVAEAAGHTQSWVSKLEHSPTDKITVRDLLEYAEALQLQLRMQFRKPMTAVQSVKHHFFQIENWELFP